MLLTHDAALHTSLQLPCTAHECCVVEHAAELAELMNRLGDRPYRVLGGGSNVLCAASHIDTVIQLAIKGITLLRTEPDAFIVQVGAGESWHATVLHTLAQGWAGLENLALIPGWVGASPVQNIGAYGVELCERLHSVQAWDTQARAMVSLAATDCQFGYRDSVFKQGAGRYLITHVTFKLPRPWKAVVSYAELAAQFAGQQPTAQAVCDAVIAIRQRKLPDPAVIPNAGSFFKNPLVPALLAQTLKAQHPTLPCYPQADGSVKLAAGWMIEHAGWKGYTRSLAAGKVGVHAAQALVLVHLGGAHGRDLLQLASDIQADVLAKFGVTLVREVNVWA
jgi:UDP-N-acetylmuramate dehydrogenase